MVDAVAENTPNVEGFDISVFDPSTWKEPVEQIPVKIIRSRPRWSDPKYNKQTEFRPAFPNRGKGPEGDSIMQWDLQFEALDREYLLLDGTKAPVILYSSVDFEKYSKGRNGSYTLAPVLKGKSKEALVINAWTKAAGSLLPDPSRLEGQLWIVDYYAQKEISPNFFAKKVYLPNSALPPDYVFTGEKQVFKQTRHEVEDSTVTASASANAFPAATDPAAAAAKIGDFIRANGFTTLDTSVLSAAGFPDGCRIEPFVSAFVAGDAKTREVLAGFGVEV